MKTTWARAAILLLTAAGVSGCGDDPSSPANQRPRIVSLTASPDRVVLGGVSRVSVLVSDTDDVDVLWSAAQGSFQDSSLSTTFWTAPDSPGTYTLSVFATDGEFSTSGEIEVEAGNASLTVLSDPPDALLSLDGVPTAFRTPFTFDPLPPGPHQVTLVSPSYAYDRTGASVTLVHGQSETVEFNIAPTQSRSLDLGRTDLQEIGGIAFVPNGYGFLYAGKTASGTGIYASSLLSQVTPKGVELISGVNLAEPISISNDGAYLFFVSENDTLTAVSITDTNSDAMPDAAGDPIRLRKGFGPSISAMDQLAFSLTPSANPATTQIFWSDFQNEGLQNLYFGTLNNGRLPSWKPFEPYVAYVRGGVVYYSYTDEDGAGASDTLAAGGFNTSPSWGPWGPQHVAYLHGDNPASLTELRLGIPSSDHQVSIAQNLVDPRFVAWTRSERSVAVSHHGGGPGIYLVTNLPIP